MTLREGILPEAIKLLITDLFSGMRSRLCFCMVKGERNKRQNIRRTGTYHDREQCI